MSVKVSVLICTYTPELYDHLAEAAESVLEGTYDDVEIVLVSDGNDEVFELMQRDFSDHPKVVVTRTEDNVGISAARNRGLEVASGDVVAQMDDDAIAHERWVEELVSVYEETDAIAVGGKMTPDWVAGKPSFLPEEFFFLIGVTRTGFAEPGEEVRNTYGSNISFRRDVLESLGGFDPNVGRRGDLEIQGHESELGTRLRQEFDRGVVYNPDAKVAHKIFGYRTNRRWIAKRAFWQGYSKRALQSLLPEATGDEETDFLKLLLFSSIPNRLRGLVMEPSVAKVEQLVWVVALTVLVGVGYLYGSVKWR